MTVRSEITVSIDVAIVARLRSIKSDKGIPMGCLTEQALSEFLDNHYPCADQFGITPSDRQSIKQASAAFEQIGHWDAPSGGAIHAKSMDKQGRKIEFDGLYIDGIATFHSVWFSGSEENIYALSDVLTPEEFEQINGVITRGMRMYIELRSSYAARN